MCVHLLGISKMKRACDMICLTRCLTVDLLPPHVGQSGEMLQQNRFHGMSLVRSDRDKTQFKKSHYVTLKWYNKISDLGQKCMAAVKMLYTQMR